MTLEPPSVTTVLLHRLSPTGKVVIFDGNGGSATAPQVITSGAKVTAPSNPTRTGYTFAGWFQDAEGTGSEFNLGTKTFAIDTYCYAKWTINTYTVTYDSNSGSACITRDGCL